MSKTSHIQWCHSTINPVMGCDGCELWPKPVKFVIEIVNSLKTSSLNSDENLRGVVSEIISDRNTADIYRHRKKIAQQILKKLKLTQKDGEALVAVIRRLCKCYAGLLGTNRAGYKGYAGSFDRVKLFPRRLAAAANYKPLGPEEVTAKPWLAGAPRMMFVIDVGDVHHELVYDVILLERGYRVARAYGLG